MKAISILGTSSNAGKSWLATAIGALLRRRGYRVAPFKAQNMSNNAYVTLTGGEIGRAQAVQAEACGVVPTVEMNPILLKPTGENGSQLVVMGEAHSHVSGGDYYQRIAQLWPIVCGALETLQSQYDVLVLEGAGSPVELNLMDRDLVNLRPVRHLDGRWILVADIERGGVFPQIIGTYHLMPEEDRRRGLGVVVNKFRGDLSLFSEARECLAQHIALPYLGVLPYRGDLQPETEDGVNPEQERGVSGGDNVIAWIRFPHHANTSDAEPWSLDRGISIRWVTRPEQLAAAKAIVLPGSKNTIADLDWLRTSGLADAILAAHRRGVLVAGICGGYQILGETLSDVSGVAGQAGEKKGLGLLPLETTYENRKKVTQVETFFADEAWLSYEIHMGQTRLSAGLPQLWQVRRNASDSSRVGEGCLRVKTTQGGAVWGTYLHGLFESGAMRTEFTRQAGMSGHEAAKVSWRGHLQTVYAGMADLLEERLELDAVWKYLDGK
ncbi:MAG: cobyric acid synthase CobQ [Verrucomicrobia bacterium Tous-C9LFEB]|nr:MAG: cobyric acid synthase CobQ [Verrucomicrobia bacterium Tous-C9LFEB]